MRVAVLVCFLLFAALAHSVSAAPRITMATPAQIVHVLDKYVRGKDGIGIVVGVVNGDSVRYYTAGDLGQDAPKLDRYTEFQIGSLTKAFTATLLAVMARNHEVALRDPIQRYLPPGVKAPAFDGRQITLEDLAVQDSGLPSSPTNFWWSALLHFDIADPYAHYTPDLLYDFLSHYELPRAPGARYVYSNLSVGLLGELLARRAGTSYETLLEQRVLAPLGLRATSITPTSSQLAHLAPGFDASADPAPVWHFGALDAAWALYSNCSDMMAFVQANLSAPRGPLGPALVFAREPQAGAPRNGVMRVGLGWNVANSGFIRHNGNSGAYHAFVGFNAAQGTGMVMLANISDAHLDAVAIQILAPAAP
ncbi:MAG TPA: serine hydrolase domain-containing protein [Candidatus Baltobacteraceae bacterium]